MYLWISGRILLESPSVHGHNLFDCFYVSKMRSFEGELGELQIFFRNINALTKIFSGFGSF